MDKKSAAFSDSRVESSYIAYKSQLQAPVLRDIRKGEGLAGLGLLTLALLQRGVSSFLKKTPVKVLHFRQLNLLAIIFASNPDLASKVPVRYTVWLALAGSLAYIAGFHPDTSSAAMRSLENNSWFRAMQKILVNGRQRGWWRRLAELPDDTWGTTLGLMPLLIAVSYGRQGRYARWEQGGVCTWLAMQHVCSAVFCTTDWQAQLVKYLLEALPTTVVLALCGGVSNIPKMALCVGSSLLSGLVGSRMDQRDRLLYVRGLELQFLESRERKQKERTERQALQVLSDARHEVKVLMNELNSLRRCNEALCHRASMCTQRGDALALSRLRNPKEGPRDRGSQVFEYVVILDFEATCRENDKEFLNEIIDFPAVLVRTDTMELVAEFRQVVKPNENPILSDFCTGLTGIAQDDVDTGVPLQVALQRFHRWLVSLGLVEVSTNIAEAKAQFAAFLADPEMDFEENFPHLGSMESSVLDLPQRFVICVDGPSDLYSFLHKECERKHIPKPSYFDQWVNMRALFAEFYGTSQLSLNNMLATLGFSFHGRMHSGLDDARNILRISERMVADGCILAINDGVDSNLSRIAAGCGKPGSVNGQANGYPLPPPILYGPQGPATMQLPKDSILSRKGHTSVGLFPACNSGGLIQIRNSEVIERATEVKFFCALEFTKSSNGCDDCLSRAKAGERVVDLQSRCPRCNVILRENKKKGIENEVIEIGSVLIDATTGLEVKSLEGPQRFVKPDILPISLFTTTCANIANSDVEHALPLERSLEQHEAWLVASDISIEEVAIVTFGDSQLASMLPAACRRHDARPPVYLRRWINLKRVFELTTGTKANSLPDMVQLLALPLHGARSAIDDAKSIGLVCRHLLAEGLSRTMVVMHETRPDTEANFVQRDKKLQEEAIKKAEDDRKHKKAKEKEKKAKKEALAEQQREKLRLLEKAEKVEKVEKAEKAEKAVQMRAMIFGDDDDSFRVLGPIMSGTSPPGFSAEPASAFPPIVAPSFPSLRPGALSYSVSPFIGVGGGALSYSDMAGKRGHQPPEPPQTTSPPFSSISGSPSLGSAGNSIAIDPLQLNGEPPFSLATDLPAITDDANTSKERYNVMGLSPTWVAGIPSSPLVSFKAAGVAPPSSKGNVAGMSWADKIKNANHGPPAS